MKALACLSLGLLAAFAARGAVDLRAKSVSASKQFTVFCSDGALRARVTSFTEEVKRGVLDLLGQREGWRIPIVISLEPAERPDEVKHPVSLRLVQTPDGPSIQMNVLIGSDPAAIHLQKHIIRAVLLDFMYRDRPPKSGEPYVEAPWWIVAGAVERFRFRDTGVDADLYRRLVETNRLPGVSEFLAGHGQELGSTAAAFDNACAFALIQLLLEQPEGKSRLSQLVRRWPDNHREPVMALTQAFPSVAPDAVSLEKWWTLNLARFGSADRYRGLSAEETDRALQELLAFDVPVDKAGKLKRFSVNDFKEFMRFRGGRKSAAQQHKAVIALSARSNVLLRPVLSSYEQVFALLAAGKTRGVQKRIDSAEAYREAVLQRKTEIGDYLNWFEATQLGASSGAFDSYLRAAKAVKRERQTTATTDAIHAYLDLLENEI